MAGEKSKEIGEYGEKVILRLLEYFGWTPILKNLDIECIRPELHKRKLKKHGIDYIKHYRCPLQSDTQKTIIISAKYYKDYPANPTLKVKEFLLDIGSAMFCIKPNSEYGRKKIDKSIKDLQLRGLLFYLNHDEGFEDSILDKIDQFRVSKEIHSFEPIYIIDNKRATFFYSIVEYIRRNFKEKAVQFAYAETEYNLDSFNNTSSGSLMPLEYIVSDLIPMRVDIDDERKALLLFTNNPFSKESFARLVGFCKSFTNGWNSKTVILFSDYRELKHKSDVDAVLSNLLESSFAKQISVESFSLQDFRKLEEN